MTREEILKAAADRAKKMELSYAGALTPREACDLAAADSSAKIIDVRTHAELQYVGRVPGAAEIEWQHYPEMAINERFLESLAAESNRESPALFICRSGVRSHYAAEAAASAGWQFAFNVLEGFEGDMDANGHRSTVGGWRFHGLPWIQS